VSHAGIYTRISIDLDGRQTATARRPCIGDKCAVALHGSNSTREIFEVVNKFLARCQNTVYKSLETVYISLMKSKTPTTVMSVRTSTALAEAIKAAADERNISVSELLNLDLAAKYYCGSDERKSLKKAQSSDDTYIPEEDEE